MTPGHNAIFYSVAAQFAAAMLPRHVRALLERLLDECAWAWCRRLSLLIDKAVVREERKEPAP